MDLISTTPIEITSQALKGLSARHNALSANIANADTPGYQRSDVNFEDQLVNILKNDKTLDDKKIQNTMKLMYTPNSIDQITKQSSNDQRTYDSFEPETLETNNPAMKTDGNNVNIEFEMAELSKNGTKYTAIATFQEKIFRGLGEVISQGGR